RSMAARIPAFSALAMVVRLAVLAGAAPPEEVSVVVISCSSSVLEAGLVGRELGGLALDQLVRVGIHVLEHLLVPGVGHRLAGVPESAGQLVGLLLDGGEPVLVDDALGQEVLLHPVDRVL